MAYTFPQAIETLVKQQLSLGGFSSEDEVLLAALQALDEKQRHDRNEEDMVVAAINESLDDIAAGRERSFDEFSRELKARHGLGQ